MYSLTPTGFPPSPSILLLGSWHKKGTQTGADVTRKRKPSCACYWMVQSVYDEAEIVIGW